MNDENNKNKNEIAIKQEFNLTPEKQLKIIDSSPAAMMQVATANGWDLDMFEKIIKLQVEHEKREAEKAFTIAMTKFKKDPPIIKKDRYNKQYGSYYASLNEIVSKCLPKMSTFGLSHNWDTKQEDGNITVIFTVTHEMGHSKSTQMTAPPDTSGAKNIVQQIKSTKTYLKSQTFEDGMGLTTSDDGDDDGNTAGLPQEEIVTEKHKNNILDMIASAEADTTKFLKMLPGNIDSIDNIPLNLYDTAIGILKLKKATNNVNNNK